MDAWLLVILSLPLCLTLHVLLRSRSRNKRRPRLPPGPPTVPFLAKFIWLRRSIFDIEPILRQLHAKLGPIVTLRVTSNPAIFIADRSLAHQALVQSGGAFADRPPAVEPNRFLTSNQYDISSSPYGPRWRLLRRNLTSEILHPSRVKLFAPARRWVLQILVDKLRAQARTKDGAVVVMESFQYAMFCLLVLMCFGEKLDEKAIKEIEAIQRYLLLKFTEFPIFGFFPKITKVLFRRRWNEIVAGRKKMEDIYIPLIKARQNRKQQSGEGSYVCSYVDSLHGIQLPEEGGRKLSESEMVSLCSEFMNAGTDTTANALQWVMANLVKHQDMQGKVAEEIGRVVGSEAEEIEEEHLQRMPYLKAVIMEGLRRHPPGHFVLPHTVAEDTTLDGYLIPKGADVNFMVAEMGWDEKVWEEPMEFKPERFSAGGAGEGVDLTGSREIKMMPFGAGRRMCPGLGLAMLHLEYFVANLVWEFEWKPADGEKVDLSENLEFTVGMKHPLRARIFPRNK
ncbi:cytochrome P450 89A2-like [Phoenix dactylifera]|uniref:Cytochrome P450 89A2-like n=1 Tax=Phoenix dactylifera TaxID=42345 RepID=A0A8B7MWE9_PHODC|nr:cytochrome P450 89A2-like [Phoenix dactylifera]